jgi:hypothetical protein
VQKNPEQGMCESNQADQDDEIRREKSHDEFVGVLHSIGRQEKIDTESKEQQGQESDGDMPDPEDVCHKNPSIAE